MALSPWNNTAVKYSILQIALGANPISKLEVVSQLNLFNQGRAMYYYTLSNRTQKYNPRVYLGTISTFAYAWNFDNFGPENVQKIDPKSWPNSYQSNTQKGEAI